MQLAMLPGRRAWLSRAVMLRAERRCAADAQAAQAAELVRNKWVHECVCVRMCVCMCVCVRDRSRARVCAHVRAYLNHLVIMARDCMMCNTRLPNLYAQTHTCA